MKEKIYSFLNKCYGVTMMVAFFGGVLPLIPYFIALIIGGTAGEAIALFLYKQYYPWIIALASISIMIGLIAMYVRGEQGLSSKAFKKNSSK